MTLRTTLLALVLTACGATETWECTCSLTCSGDDLGSLPVNICAADDPSTEQADQCGENLVNGQNECADDSTTSCTCSCSPSGEACS